MKKEENKKRNIYYIIGGIIIIIILLLLVSCNRRFKVEFTVDNQSYYNATIQKGDTLENIVEPKKDGYIFAGWYVDNEKFDMSTPITKNVKLEARWVEGTFTVEFDLDNGKEYVVKQVKPNDTVEKIETPTKKGYTFLGWYVGNEKYDFNSKVTSSLKIVAKWEEITKASYKVEHYLMNLDGKNYTLEESETFTGLIGSQVSPKTKEYVGFISPDVKTTTIKKDGKTVVQYHYEREKYTLDLSGDYGIENIVGAGTYYYGEKVKISYNLKPGYSFSNYSESLKDDVYTMKNHDETIEISTKANTDTNYTVEHYLMDIDGENYTLIARDTYKGTTDTEITPSVKDYVGFKSPEQVRAVINGDGTTVVKYYYERNKYELKISKDEGISSVTGEGMYYFEEEIHVKADVMEGYSFANWTVDTGSLEENTENELTFKMGASDATLQANSKVNTYTVTYELGSVDVVFNDEKNVSVSYLDTIEKPTDPTRIGYKFLGWFKESEGTNEWNFEEETMPHKDITLYAKWEAVDVNYTVWHIKMDTTGHYPNITSNEECSTNALCELETLQGKADSTINVAVKDYGNGFTKPTETTATIKPDGTTVVKYEYERKQFNLTVHGEGNGLNWIGNSENGNKDYAAGMHYYEEEVTIEISAKSKGYHINSNGKIVTTGTATVIMPDHDYTFNVKAEGHLVNVYYHNYDNSTSADMPKDTFNYDDSKAYTLKENKFTKADPQITIKNYDGKNGETTVTLPNKFLGWSTNPKSDANYKVSYTDDLTGYVPGSCTDLNLYAVYGILGTNLESKINNASSKLTFVGFSLDADGNKMITKTEDGYYIDNVTTIYAIFDETYSVRHIMMNTTGSYPTIDSDATCESNPLCELETLKSRQGSTVTPEFKTELEGTSVCVGCNDHTAGFGFKAPETQQTVTLEGDGTTTVEYKYIRNKFHLTAHGEGNGLNWIGKQENGLTDYDAGDYYYNEKVEIQISAKSNGYHINSNTGIVTTGKVSATMPDYDYIFKVKAEGHTVTVAYHNWDGKQNNALMANDATFNYDDDKPAHTLKANQFTKTLTTLKIKNYNGNGEDQETDISITNKFLGWSTNPKSDANYTVSYINDLTGYVPKNCVTLNLYAVYGIEKTTLESKLSKGSKKFKGFSTDSTEDHMLKGNETYYYDVLEDKSTIYAIWDN